MVIKLPIPFNQILDSHYQIGGYNIVEAYLDKKDYKNFINNGIKDLREFLELNESDICSDCFCIINAKNRGEFGILFEDKKTKHSHDIFRAKDQLQDTCKRLIGKGKNVDYAIVCNIKIGSEFDTRRADGYPARIITSPLSPHKPISLEKITNLKRNKIPFLYHS